ncbi:hypothetical protein Btru_054740 [Bulinus truncatus]|nr:hypothetical protein Btru_054740 [Bulinus truncatus]
MCKLWTVGTTNHVFAGDSGYYQPCVGAGDSGYYQPCVSWAQWVPLTMCKLGTVGTYSPICSWAQWAPPSMCKLWTRRKTKISRTVFLNGQCLGSLLSGGGSSMSKKGRPRGAQTLSSQPGYGRGGDGSLCPLMKMGAANLLQNLMPTAVLSVTKYPCRHQMFSSLSVPSLPLLGVTAGTSPSARTTRNLPVTPTVPATELDVQER